MRQSKNDETEFLIRQLNSLAVRFPAINIKYGFDLKIHCHIVQLPKNEFEDNDELTNAWIPISIQFMESFDAEIAFIPDDSSLALSKIICEWNKK